MIGFYNYTVILTYVGMISGFIGILRTASGDIRAALLCLMIAGICDMFDGRIASTMVRTRQEKRFGIQIDSLSDLICFGVLPGIIGYHCAGKTLLAAGIAASYTLCALIRLAWFNVDEEERQEQEQTRRKVYLGMPVTASALLLPLFIGAGRINGLPLETKSHWILAVMALDFLTPFQLKKPGKSGTGLLVLMGMAVFITVMRGFFA